MRDEHGMLRGVYISRHDFCPTFRWYETPAGFPESGEASRKDLLPFKMKILQPKRRSKGFDLQSFKLKVEAHEGSS